jgi:hypothetical protein
MPDDKLRLFYLTELYKLPFIEQLFILYHVLYRFLLLSKYHFQPNKHKKSTEDFSKDIV